MSMGSRRRAHTAAAAIGAAGAAVTVATDSVSPALDSGATSPDAIPPTSASDVRTTRSNTEVAATLEPSSRPADKCDSCADLRSNSNSNSNGRRSCSYKFRRGGKTARAKGGGGGGGGNRPPEVHVKQHGRGGGKEKGWRSMHVVQSLKYHEVRLSMA